MKKYKEKNLGFPIPLEYASGFLGIKAADIECLEAVTRNERSTRQFHNGTIEFLADFPVSIVLEESSYEGYEFGALLRNI